MESTTVLPTDGTRVSHQGHLDKPLPALLRTVPWLDDGPSGTQGLIRFGDMRLFEWHSVMKPSWLARLARSEVCRMNTCSFVIVFDFQIC